MSRLPDVHPALVAPVPGPAPAGTDATYEPAFERLRQAVDRLDSVGTAVDHESVASGAGAGPFGGGAGADYGAVVDDALVVLAEHSKDLRAAAYLVAALARTDGAAGVAAGLGGLAVMAHDYWPDLFPPAKRMRARRAAFEYLTSRVGSAVAAWPRPTPAEREALAAAITATGDLQLLVSAEMGADAPVLSGMRRALAERQKRADALAAQAAPATSGGPSVPDTRIASAGAAEPAAEPEDDVASADASDDATADAQARTPPQPVPVAVAPRLAPSAVGGAATGADGVDPVRAVLQAAAAIRDGEALSVTAVRLLRVVRWDALAAPPPATGAATRVEAPPARQRDALVALAASDPALFAEQAERTFAAPPAHFWLDLQRLSDEALASLGPAAAATRAAVRAEAARLVERLPALLTLTFRDGTPFADAATRAWAAGLATAPVRADVSDGGMAESLFRDARAQAAAGDLPNALDALTDALPPGGRAGFVHRLQTAEVALGAGRADLALALLDALVADAHAHRLGAWEPRLAADLYAALGQAARQAARPDAAEAADAQLAAIAPARAARLVSL